MTNAYTENMLNKSEFDKFMSESMTVAEDRAYRDLVDNRFETILKEIFNKCGYTFYLNRYDNSSSYENDGQHIFDVGVFKDNVDFEVEFESKNKNFALDLFKYEKSFPTSWLYTDFEVELNDAIAEVVAECELQKSIALAEKLQEEHTSVDIDDAKKRIKEMLPPELLKYISFVSAKDLKINVNKINKENKKEVAKYVKGMKIKGVVLSQEYKDYIIDGGHLDFHDWLMDIYKKRSVL